MNTHTIQQQNIPRILLHACVFVLPWQTIYILHDTFYHGEKWQYGTIGVYLSDVFFVAFCISALIVHRKQCIAFCKNNGKIIVSAVFLCLWWWMSGIWAPNLSLAFFTAGTMTLGMLFLLLLSITPYNTRALARTFVISMCIHALIGLWQFFTQDTIAVTLCGLQYHDIWHGSTATISTETQRWLRTYGGQAHPNIFGGLLLVALLHTAWLYLTHTTRKYYDYVFLLSAFVVLFAGMLCTFSRSVWGAFCFVWVGMLLYLFVVYKKTHAAKIGIFLTGVCIAVATLFYAFFPSLFIAREHATTRTHNSFYDRAAYMHHAQELIAQHPFTGVGIGNYTNAVAIEHYFAQPMWYYQPVHNVYMLILTETGIVGCILLCTFIMLCLRSFTPHIRTPADLCLVACICALLIIALWDHWLWDAHVGVFVLCLLYGMFLRNQKRRIAHGA